MIELLPIMKTLWRKKTGPLLIVIQLAVTLAIASNALFIIQQRSATIDRPSGIAIDELIRFPVRITVDDTDMGALVRQDISEILAHEDVIAASHISSIPLSGSGSSTGFRLDADPNSSGGHTAAHFRVSEHTVDTLGLEVIEGRKLRADEVNFIGRNETPKNAKVLVTKSFADVLFPSQSALGKRIYNGERFQLEIVGVVSDMMGPWPDSEIVNRSVLVPITNQSSQYHYIVRTLPEKREALLLALHERLNTRDHRRIVLAGTTLEATKRESYQRDYAMKNILAIVVALIIAVNILGLIGMTSFWVNQRRKQIGIRRALGASRNAITRYFLLENTVICAAAIIIGTVLALLANGSMRASFSSAILPFSFILYCAVVLVLFSIMSVLVPALRASRVAPSVATAS